MGKVRRRSSKAINASVAFFQRLEVWGLPLPQRNMEVDMIPSSNVSLWSVGSMDRFRLGFCLTGGL